MSADKPHLDRLELWMSIVLIVCGIQLVCMLAVVGILVLRDDEYPHTLLQAAFPDEAMTIPRIVLGVVMIICGAVTLAVLLAIYVVMLMLRLGFLVYDGVSQLIKWLVLRIKSLAACYARKSGMVP